MIEFDKEKLSGMKILIVDDTPANLDILGHILQRSNLNVSFAPNGEKALELVHQNKPDLVLLDVMMPGIDGYEVCARLKADTSTKDIPIIFITALGDTEGLVKGYNVGAIDYIAKPFHEKEVVCRITTQLRLKQAQDEVVQREKFYRVIVESVPDLIFQLDPDRNIEFANPAFRLLGYEPEELVGRPIADLIVSDEKESLLDSLATRHVGPLAVTDLAVTIKISEEVSLVEEMAAQNILVDSVGLWNVSDEDVFKNNMDKKFLGTLCVGKKAS
ncbi:MAG: response regulator [Nitrospinaceae bacterium]|nr:response regulator [Nitrospinaceae bacterium]